MIKRWRSSHLPFRAGQLNSRNRPSRRGTPRLIEASVLSERFLMGIVSLETRPDQYDQLGLSQLWPVQMLECLRSLEPPGPPGHLVSRRTAGQMMGEIPHVGPVVNRHLATSSEEHADDQQVPVPLAPQLSYSRRSDPKGVVNGTRHRTF